MKPSSKDFAQALTQTSLSFTEKEQILQSLPYLSDQKITAIYVKLKELLKEEEQFIKTVERTDLKYQMKVQEALKNYKG